MGTAFKKNCLGAYIMVMVIAGCSTTPELVKKFVEEPSNKIQLRAYFPDGPVLYLNYVFLE